MPTLLARARFWPGIAAVILITIVLLPPAAGYARQYAFAQALQFVIFAVAGPALLALGTPWRTCSPTGGIVAVSAGRRGAVAGSVRRPAPAGLSRGLRALGDGQQHNGVLQRLKAVRRVGDDEQVAVSALPGLAVGCEQDTAA